MLAPFAKKPLQLTLRGITTDEHDLSVGIFSSQSLLRLNSYRLIYFEQ
jgi:RNA 3'-terminal phosphate cyclase-like protein